MNYALIHVSTMFVDFTTLTFSSVCPLSSVGRHSVARPHVPGTGDSFRIRRVAANLLNKSHEQPTRGDEA
jgi:hypothetical protein